MDRRTLDYKFLVPKQLEKIFSLRKLLDEMFSKRFSIRKLKNRNLQNVCRKQCYFEFFNACGKIKERDTLHSHVPITITFMKVEEFRFACVL